MVIILLIVGSVFWSARGSDPLTRYSWSYNVPKRLGKMLKDSETQGLTQVQLRGKRSSRRPISRN